MNKILLLFTFTLLTVTPVRGEAPDSLQLLVQQGDSCMLR
jgi:hypothetical protein